MLQGESGHFESQSRDHLLIRVWMLEEEDQPATLTTLSSEFSDAGELAETLEAAGTVLVDDDGVLTLTKVGGSETELLVRRYRLASVLLRQVFAVPTAAAGRQAHEFEHVLSPEVTDRICTFLAHPSQCPMGRPIPPGPCCSSAVKSVTPLVQPLMEIKPGETVTIAFVNPKSHARMDRLASMGVLPGTKILLHQKSPAVVIRVGETELAIESQVADDIYVQRTEE